MKGTTGGHEIEISSAAFGSGGLRVVSVVLAAHIVEKEVEMRPLFYIKLDGHLLDPTIELHVVRAVGPRIHAGPHQRLIQIQHQRHPGQRSR